MAKEDNMIKRQKEYAKSKIEYGKKIVDEMKLLEEDIKGAAVDTTVV